VLHCAEQAKQHRYATSQTIGQLTIQKHGKADEWFRQAAIACRRILDCGGIWATQTVSRARPEPYMSPHLTVSNASVVLKGKHNCDTKPRLTAAGSECESQSVKDNRSCSRYGCKNECFNRKSRRSRRVSAPNEASLSDNSKIR